MHLASEQGILGFASGRGMSLNPQLPAGFFMSGDSMTHSDYDKTTESIESPSDAEGHLSA